MYAAAGLPVYCSAHQAAAAVLSSISRPAGVPTGSASASGSASTGSASGRANGSAAGPVVEVHPGRRRPCGLVGLRLQVVEVVGSAGVEVFGVERQLVVVGVGGWGAEVTEPGDQQDGNSLGRALPRSRDR